MAFFFLVFNCYRGKMFKKRHSSEPGGNSDTNHNRHFGEYYEKEVKSPRT